MIKRKSQGKFYKRENFGLILGRCIRFWSGEKEEGVRGKYFGVANALRREWKELRMERLYPVQ